MGDNSYDIRFELDAEYDAEDLINEIGKNLEWVQEAVELRNDGFANLIPDEETRRVFHNGSD